MLGCYLGVRGLETCYGSPSFRRDALDQDFIDQKYVESRFSRKLLDKKQKARPRSGLPPMAAAVLTVHWNELPKRILKRFLFWLWSLSDYGRSLLGVLLYVAATIGAIGLLYDRFLIPQHHALLAGQLAEDPQLPFSPWYAAAMGAATLGLTDLMKPLDIWGELAMFGNALAGLLLFGMMVAVLQNKFARRS